MYYAPTLVHTLAWMPESKIATKEGEEKPHSTGHILEPVYTGLNTFLFIQLH